MAAMLDWDDLEVFLAAHPSRGATSAYPRTRSSVRTSARSSTERLDFIQEDEPLRIANEIRALVH